jgi:predicted MFS family arabinose efflux permease
MAWGLIPLGSDESDIRMTVLVIALLALLVLLIFVFLPLSEALFISLIVLVGFLVAYSEIRRILKMQKDENT